MSDCKYSSECKWFNTEDENVTIKKMLVNRLCLGDTSDCAIFMVADAKGMAQVSSDMIPNQISIAKQIIAS